MGLFILMKKYYVNLPIVFGWGFILIIGIVGFIWETLDLRTFNVFSLIMSVIIPIVLEIIIILIFAQYCKFDDYSIKKFLFNKIIKELKWENIKEVRSNQGYLYISVEILIGEKKQWNSKNYIALLCTDELMSEVRKHLTDNIIVNF